MRQTKTPLENQVALLYFNHYLTEYSCKAQPTLNNYINKLFCRYMELRNYLSGPLV